MVDIFATYFYFVVEKLFSLMQSHFTVFDTIVNGIVFSIFLLGESSLGYRNTNKCLYCVSFNLTKFTY